MKRLLAVWFMLFVLTIPHVKAQSITAYRYWFDDAFSATAHPVSNANNVFNSSFNTEGVAVGFHIVNMQFMDNNSRWSSVVSEQFYRAKTGIEVSGYEYWFDDDYANAVNKAEVANLNFDLNVLINTGTLPTGFHKFNIHFKTQGGDWSIVTTDEFYKVKTDTEIEAYQYWFDDDFTNAILKNMVATGDLDVPISTTSVSDGIHILNMRFKTKGGDWSIPISSEFYRTKTGTAITGYQYWFDDAFSSRTTKTVTTTTSLNLNVDINTQTLEQGYHRFNIRFKTENGDWSVPTAENFYKLPVGNNKISAYRYWFNDNFQNAITVNLPTPLSDYNLNASIDTRFAPSTGINTIHFQFKTERGDWSVPTSDDYNSNVAKVAGVTVIVHGFQLFGSFPPEFEDMAKAIRTRAGRGSIFRNNPISGRWEALDNNNTNNPSDEIILLYDWADLSNENLINTGFDGNGYLESAADNLFALLTNSPISLSSSEKLLDRPIHFIGHSRGTILILQTLHRIRKYFPSVDIEQVTFLDPHPATSFGDVKGSFLLNNVESLPCVQGQAYVCDELSCLNADFDEIKINMPDNVLNFDNYYRKDGAYEELLILNGILELASFDGVPTLGGGSFDRQIVNSQLSNTYTSGGSHSAVHAWYFGTINNVGTVDYGNIKIDDGGALSSSRGWYNPNQAFINPNLVANNENRRTLGYNRSRVGGQGYPVNTSDRISLNEMETALKKRTKSNGLDNGYGLRPVFNGDFNYGDGGAGWIGNGAKSTSYNLEDNMGRLLNDGVDGNLQHSFFYFTPEMSGNTIVSDHYTWLRFKMKSPSNSHNITIKFKNLTQTVQAYSATINLNISNAEWRTIYCPIPISMKSQVGTFEIIDNDESTFGFIVFVVNVDDFEFTNDIPTANDIKMADPVVLPVELTKFTGKCQNNKVALNWQTASEKNSDHFELLYSTSPQSGWKTLTSIPAKGNSSVLSDYNYLFDNPTRLTYYRLRQVDRDGGFHYSPTIAVECAGKEHYLKVYPNPTDNFVYLETDVNEGALVIEIYNVYGQQVLKKQYDSGFYPIEIPLTGIEQAGTYIVKVLRGNGEMVGVKRLVVD